jgi:hypothetical protein
MGRRAHRLAGSLVVTRRRLWIAAGAAAAVVALVVVLALNGGSHSVELPQQAVSGQTELSRSGTLFADPLRASVHVLVDRHRVDPARVGFTTTFDPYVRVGLPHVARRDTGPVTELTYSTELICLTNLCLSKTPGDSVRMQFPPAEVFYTPKSGARQTLRLVWPALEVGSRVSPIDVSSADPFIAPSWRASATPGAVTYDISPRLLRTLLYLGAGLLFAVGLFALLRFVRIGKLRFRILSPLERAVVLVERSHEGSPEKRKALELLSRELARSGEPELALLARELAWAEPAPLPTTTQPLTLDVRRVIDQRSNGHTA